MSHRGAAAAVWLALAVCAGTGCIPIPVAVVQTGLTSGERLRAIHQELADLDSMPRNDDPTVVQMRVDKRMELLALRRQLLAHPLCMDASIHRWTDSKDFIADYWSCEPGLYAPVEQELADLKRARDAGVLNQAEFEELSQQVAFQALRSLVRRQSSDASEKLVPGTVTSYFGQTYGVRSTPKSRAKCALEAVKRWSVSEDINATRFGDWSRDVGGGQAWLVPELPATAGAPAKKTPDKAP